MRVLVACLFTILAALPAGAAKELQIYFVDVEGGQATLIVSPSGKSMLVDAGWPGFNGRDADRIAAAAKLAGVQQIDFLLVTHYHMDHIGGVPQIAERMRVVTFVDHGPNTEQGKQALALTESYAKALSKGRHLIAEPGDKISLGGGAEIEIVAARGGKIAKALKGAGAANEACAEAQPQKDDPSENARSIGFVLRLGKFRFVDLGDLTWNKELELACPNNLVGTADVYLVTHHGMNISNAPALVRAIRPRVAIMNNGAKKGGSPDAWQVVRTSPGLEDLWQLHYALKGGDAANSPADFIANPEENCQGHWLKLTAAPDGSYTVLNGRNNFVKKYR